jgi:hypothetical protein
MSPCPTGTARAVLWDLVSDPQILGAGRSDELAARTFRVALAPGTVKIVAYVPEEVAEELAAPSDTISP